MERNRLAEPKTRQGISDCSKAGRQQGEAVTVTNCEPRVRLEGVCTHPSSHVASRSSAYACKMNPHINLVPDSNIFKHLRFKKKVLVPDQFVTSSLRYVT